jgi:hypothetical protein
MAFTIGNAIVLPLKKTYYTDKVGNPEPNTQASCDDACDDTYLWRVCSNDSLVSESDDEDQQLPAETNQN